MARRKKAQVSEPETTQDLSEMKKDELQQIAEDRDLPKSGTKEELVERITESDNEGEFGTTERDPLLSGPQRPSAEDLAAKATQPVNQPLEGERKAEVEAAAKAMAEPPPTLAQALPRDKVYNTGEM